MISSSSGIRPVFQNSQQVYANCISTHPQGIFNKNLVRTFQSNNRRVASILSGAYLAGSIAFVPRNINEFQRAVGQSGGSGSPPKNKF